MAISRNSRSYVVRYEVKRSFSSKADAERFEKLLRAHIQTATLEYDNGGDCPTLASHADEWLADLRDNGATEERVERCRRVLWRMRYELLADRDDLTLNEIHKGLLKQWRNRRCREVCAATVNGEIAVIRAYANWCVDEEYWTPGIAGMRWLKLKRLEHATKQPDPVTEAQFGSIVSRLPEQIRIPWTFQWLSADRPGAWQALRWSDVTIPDISIDRDTGEIRVVAQGQLRLSKRKGGIGKERVIPVDYNSLMHQTLLEARSFFHRVRGRAPNHYDPVFITARAKGSAWSGPTFNSALKYHLARIGERRRCPYTVRHSVATSLIRDGANAHQAQAALGHENFRTTDNYVHLMGSDSAEALQRVEARLAPFMARPDEEAKQGHDGPQNDPSNLSGTMGVGELITRCNITGC